MVCLAGRTKTAVLRQNRTQWAARPGTRTQVNKLLSLEEEPPSSALAERKAHFPKTRPLPENVANAAPRLVAVPRPRLVIGPASNAFRKRFFPAAKSTEWNDWRWQNRNRIRTAEQLERMLRLTDDEREADRKSVV